MKMIVVIYGGPRPELLPDLLDRQRVIGWTQLPGAHGAGRTGRREGTRAWPGESLVFFTIVDGAEVAALLTAIHDLAGAALPGERLHAAAVPVERFF